MHLHVCEEVSCCLVDSEEGCAWKCRILWPESRLGQHSRFVLFVLPKIAQIFLLFFFFFARQKRWIFSSLPHLPETKITSVALTFVFFRTSARLDVHVFSWSLFRLFCFALFWQFSKMKRQCRRFTIAPSACFGAVYLVQDSVIYDAGQKQFKTLSFCNRPSPNLAEQTVCVQIGFKQKINWFGSEGVLNPEKVFLSTTAVTFICPLALGNLTQMELESTCDQSNAKLIAWRGRLILGEQFQFQFVHFLPGNIAIQVRISNAVTQARSFVNQVWKRAYNRVRTEPFWKNQRRLGLNGETYKFQGPGILHRKYFDSQVWLLPWTNIPDSQQCIWSEHENQKFISMYFTLQRRMACSEDSLAEVFKRTCNIGVTGSQPKKNGLANAPCNKWLKVCKCSHQPSSTKTCAMQTNVWNYFPTRIKLPLEEIETFSAQTNRVL